jgi:hypothetical protein
LKKIWETFLQWAAEQTVEIESVGHRQNRLAKRFASQSSPPPLIPRIGGLHRPGIPTPWMALGQPGRQAPGSNSVRRRLRETHSSNILETDMAEPKTPPEIGPRRYINTKEAAKILGFSEKSLETFRSTKRHDIPYFRVGRRILYEVTQIISWLEQHRVN